MPLPMFKLVKQVTITGTRYNAGGYVNGVWADTSAALNITGNVQPITGEQLKALPENQRDKKVIQIWTQAVLRTVDESAGTKADTVVYQGDTYEVTEVRNWVAGRLDHYHVTCVRLDENV